MKDLSNNKKFLMKILFKILYYFNVLIEDGLLILVMLLNIHKIFIY